ncbi:CCR4-NOT transcription complex subunit 6-like, partial [Xyrauchen texanus]|uniref:CCR4-NOT transcription complex subunit 6-like n=1 Tax=Xyrauchen texanus TaxID=154827 RepID=UPI002241D8F2
YQHGCLLEELIKRELLLNNNCLRVLPYELGRLFQLQTLGLKGNPLSQDILSLYQEPDGTRKLLNYMLDNLAVHPEQLPQRSWITLKEREQMMPTAVFTVMCYNVLCDKYATRQLYGYCPTWALNWEYRKKGIMEEITNCDADIISLQEVETEQYYTFFLATLKERGYDGFFCPKSRAKLVSEQERKHVDGCAVFFKTEKFALVQKHTVECVFNQVAMANSEGSEIMLNRVMTKDNIGVAVLLEVKKDMFASDLKQPPEKQLLLVANAHMHWDPEYSDVKLIQTMMLLSELKSIAEKASGSINSASPTSDTRFIPIVLCADLNSLPDSAFRRLANSKNVKSDGSITHSFQLKCAYKRNLMPFTNYTYDFNGVIDYIFFSKTHMSVLGVLGPLESQWLKDNSITGCPHPHIPSDHFSLLAQLEYLPSLPSLNGLHLPVHRITNLTVAVTMRHSTDSRSSLERRSTSHSARGATMWREDHALTARGQQVCTMSDLCHPVSPVSAPEPVYASSAFLSAVHSSGANLGLFLRGSGCVTLNPALGIMDPAAQLVGLRQGSQTVEAYIMDFCVLAYQVNFNEVALKTIFQCGLNEPTSSLMPGGRCPLNLVQFIDLALLYSGSSFTVGEADTEPALHTTAPVSKPTTAPVSKPTTAPVSKPVTAPVSKPGTASESTPMPATAREPAPMPATANEPAPMPATANEPAPCPPRPTSQRPCRPRSASQRL